MALNSFGALDIELLDVDYFDEIDGLLGNSEKPRVVSAPTAAKMRKKGKPRAKLSTRRWSITRAQLTKLEKVFLEVESPSVALRQEIARELGVTPRQVSIWFRNRRQKVRLSGGELQGKTDAADAEVDDDDDDESADEDIALPLNLLESALSEEVPAGNAERNGRSVRRRAAPSAPDAPPTKRAKASHGSLAMSAVFPFESTVGSKGSKGILPHLSPLETKAMPPTSQPAMLPRAPKAAAAAQAAAPGAAPPRLPAATEAAPPSSLLAGRTYVPPTSVAPPLAALSMAPPNQMPNHLSMAHAPPLMGAAAAAPTEQLPGLPMQLQQLLALANQSAALAPGTSLVHSLLQGMNGSMNGSAHTSAQMTSGRLASTFGGAMANSLGGNLVHLGSSMVQPMPQVYKTPDPSVHPASRKQLNFMTAAERLALQHESQENVGWHLDVNPNAAWLYDRPPVIV